MKGFKYTKPRSAAHRLALSIANTGKTHSPETRIKLRLDKLGKKRGPHKPETIEKMRASSKRGSDSPFWRGGVATQNVLIRASSEHRQWARAVKERDDFTCQHCGVRGGTLHSDHIKPFSLFPEFRFEVDNGRTLCEACHHKTPTWGRNVLTA